jgi:hypothetical protein
MKKSYFYLVLTALLFAPFMMHGQTNLLSNGDFETWTNSTTPGGWVTYQNIAQETTTVHSGTYSAAHTSAASFKKLIQKVNVVAGHNYTISFWYYDNTPNAKIKLKTAWLDSTGQELPNQPSDFQVNLNPNDSLWHQYSAIVTAPTGVKKVRFDIRVLKQVNSGGTVYYDDMYFGDVVSTPEPSKHVTNFIGSAHGLSATLQWVDAIGNVLPNAYLVVGAKGSANLVAPVDGTPVADDLDWSDGTVAVNVPVGYKGFDFTELEGNTSYNFKIYPYTNAGQYIDYKTNDTVPATSVTTRDVEEINFEGFETGTSGTWTAHDISGAEEWIFPFFNGRHTAKITGAGNANEDWLVSPKISLNGYNVIEMSFWNTKSGSGDSLRLLVSTNYTGSGDPTTATWTDITDSVGNWSPGSYQAVIADSINLNNYAGQDIYLAFKFTSAAGETALYKLDNLQVFGKKSTGTGINEINEARLAIYPNPAKNYITVESKQKGILTMFDTTGKLVLQQNIENGNNRIQISNFDTGVYYIHVVLEDGSKTINKLLIK